MKLKTINNRDYFVVDIDARRTHFFSDLHKWLHAHTTGHWTTMSTVVGFKSERDAMFLNYQTSNE
jgi:hypothetical protein